MNYCFLSRLKGNHRPSPTVCKKEAYNDQETHHILTVNMHSDKKESEKTTCAKHTPNDTVAHEGEVRQRVVTVQ